ncbi:hypothetical protein CQJ94_05010 [Glycomyces fuscus]|nr:hypothetical protein CQJ94_05010 [Glycomyces fuscus]
MNDNRHLDPENFAEAVSLDVPFEHPIMGDPKLSVFISPGRRQIGLRVPRASREGKIETGLPHLWCRSVLLAGKQYVEVVIDAPKMFAEGYMVLCLIADRIQISGHSVSSAITDTVRSIGKLLGGRSVLTPERELGLFGELVTLRALIGRISPVEAMDGWLGPTAEEHDFSLRELDLEAKSTLSETRAHWIPNITQLVPTMGKPLWMISHQFTIAGANQGKSLTDLITETRATLNGALLTKFNCRLMSAGWSEVSEKEGQRRFRSRTPPLLYAVDDTFPRLTPATLASAGVNTSSITEVRYRIDLSAVPHSGHAPPFLKSALDSGGII